MADLLKSNQVLLSSHENSLDFGNLLSKIYDYCESYLNDPKPFRNKFGIGDVKFFQE